tara:strand:- start:1657 stop:2643 length:987 start_codon:yes stop_codon:yes gene_type:complete
MTHSNPLSDVINRILLEGGYVNAHSHLDRAYTITRETLEKTNSHLQDKWFLIDEMKRTCSVMEYRDRIKNALMAQKFYNSQVVCSFIDIDPVVHYTALTGATIAKEDLEFDEIKLIIACQTLKGVLEKEPRNLLETVIDSIDIIGSLPGADSGKEAAHLDVVMDWAKQTGKRLHVHVDQNNRPFERETELLARKTMEHGLESRVTAIHSISLACHPKTYREEVYKMCIDADLTFICCPSAWIDHKRSEILAPIHNSITPVDELLNRGLRVAIGSDNICDLYKPYCDGDIVNELRLLIDACRIYDEEEIINIAVHNGREVLGLNDGERK